jgi:hypothetical protein
MDMHTATNALAGKMGNLAPDPAQKARTTPEPRQPP